MPIKAIRMFLVLLGMLLLAGCGRDSQTNDPAQALPEIVKSHNELDTTNALMPGEMKGTQSIQFTNDRSYSFNDTGTRRVTYEGVLSPEKIVQWIVNGNDQLGSEQADLKSFELTVFGGFFTIINGAGLVDHLTCHNCEATVQDDDLRISASLDDEGPVLIVINDALSKSYLIENSDNWYGESIGMIQRNEYTIIDLKRKSDAQTISVSYDDGQIVHALTQVYEEYEGSFSKGYQAVVAPAGSELLITSAFASPQAIVYHLTYEKDGQSSLIDRLNKQKKFAAANQLQAYGKDVDVIQELSGGPTSRSITVSQQEKQLVLVVEPTYSFLIEINTSEFEAIFDFSYNNEYVPYNGTILTDRILNENILEEQLGSVFGEGMTTVYGDKYFSYQPIPGKTYDKIVTLESIFGEEIETRVQYSTPQIDSRSIEQSVLSNTTISILPKSGVFQDVLIQYKNIESFEVIFEPCTIDTSPDMLQDYQGQGVENYFFECDATRGEKVGVSPGDEAFEYWRAYRTPVGIPESLADANAFRVWFTDLQGQLQSHYLLKSDIGVWGKVSDHVLWLWAFGMDDGVLLDQATVTVKTLEGTVVDIITLEQGQGNVSLPEPVSTYENRWRDGVFLVEIDDGESMTLMVVEYDGGNSIRIQASGINGDNYRYLAINSRLMASEVVGADQDAIQERGTFEPLKVYGYADRGMYKAGDTIHISGFVRDVLSSDDLSYLEGLSVTVTISQPYQGSPYVLESLPLDRFGGFEGSVALPEAVALGDYLIQYQIDQHDMSSYSHIVKVQEYQKPTFYTSMSTVKSNGMLSVELAPEYYFGSPLAEYDINLTWSLAGDEICRYCRRENQDEWYFNHVFDTPSSTGGNIVRYGLTGSTSMLDLLPLSSLTDQGYAYSLKLSLIVKETITGETQYFTDYVDFDPEVMIGLSGQPVEWVYKNATQDTLENWKVDGVITEGLDSVESIEYEVYYHGYEQGVRKGVDAHLYFINDYPYELIGSGVLMVQNEFTVPTTMINSAGSYLIRVVARDEDGKGIGEVHKRVERYVYGGIADGMLGSVPNNYSLIVTVPEKTYNEGETIPIDIMPYQQGSQVVVTVEKGQYILDSYVMTLDGGQISVPVKPSYSPQVTISVMQFQSTDANSSVRKEPRFFAGYTEVSIDTAMHALDIAIQTDKEVYAPGEEVTMTLKTTDHQGDPIDARVSVAVVDQALANLYHTIKEPIPYFFSKIGTSVATYTNLKLLYQSLKVFATGGVKGGSGQGGKGMFAYVRDDLEDAAFWSGSVITENGKATLRFTVPDNLTTWMIDTIGISTDTRLGVATDTIRVTKDFLLETNPPLYLTLGDRIELPIKAIVLGEIQEGEMVKGTAWITNAFGDRYELGGFETLPGRNQTVPLTFPVTRRESPYIIVHVSGIYGDFEDGISHRIPLRTEGLMIRESQGTLSQQGTFSAEIPKSYTAKQTTRVSSLPSTMLGGIASKLLTQDLGSTQQTMTTIWGVALLDELKKSGRFEDELFDGGIIHTTQGPQTVQQFIDNGLSRVLGNQQADGGFSYRGREYTSVNPGVYRLNAYVYGGLLEMETKTKNPRGLRESIEPLEEFLWEYRMIDQTAYVYTLMQQSLAGGVLTDAQRDVLDEIVSFSSSGYLPLMRYVIAVSQDDQSTIDQWRRVGVVPTNGDEEWSISQAYLSQTSAQTLLLRAKSLDTSVSHQERLDTVMTILKLKGKDGLRGGTMSETLQAMLSVREVLTVRPTAQVRTCVLTYDGKEQTITIDENSSVTFSHLIEGSSTVVERSCDAPVLIDTMATYMPYDLTATSDATRHVTMMDRTLSDYQATIGSETTIIGSFATDVPGEQVVVDLFVPADYKLLSVVSARDDQQTYPLEVSDRHCYPDHWETRFDRLMLYYDILEAGVCDISTSALKAYSGSTTVMPMRVQELYRGDINGRKVIPNRK